MIYVANAFSLSMLDPTLTHRLHVKPMTDAEVRYALDNTPNGYTSAVGHADTAALLGVDCNRTSIKLTLGDILFVAQYSGPRLPEGATTLPPGATIQWFHVSLLNRHN